MDYRPLEPDEEVLPGDWWPSRSTDLTAAPNWFDHPTMGRCFRIDAAEAKVLNDWIWAGVSDTAGLYRDDFQDF